jgi:ubiquinone/menaquinone biosynthesis C-methylase UbiE
MTIADDYDAAAAGYVEHLAHELDHKPLDRHVLNRFAEAMPRGGLVADLGCGPGHVARYLAERTAASVVGIDISPKMIEIARQRYAGDNLDYAVGDMRRLAAFADASLAGAIAFYSIVHFTVGQLPIVVAELRRVLAPRGLALLAFHISNAAGDTRVRVDELFGARVALDFYYHPAEIVSAALAEARLPVIETCIREPYPGVEYPSRRAYLLACGNT